MDGITPVSVVLDEVESADARMVYGTLTFLVVGYKMEKISDNSSYCPYSHNSPSTPPKFKHHGFGMDGQRGITIGDVKKRLAGYVASS